MPTIGSGVQCNMNGAFTCTIRVHNTRGNETPSSRTLQVGKSTNWTYQELVDAGEVLPLVTVNRVHVRVPLATEGNAFAHHIQTDRQHG